MSVAVTRKEDKVIITVKQDLDTQEIAEEMKSNVLDLVDKGERQIVLDLDQVQFINSLGIGKILMLYKHLKEQGGELYVSPLKGKVKEVFELLMLDRLFRVYKNPRRLSSTL